MNGLTRPTHLGRVLLVAQRQLERGLVDKPALLAGHLQHEDVMGVVVDGEALRSTRRVVRIHLSRMSERALERAAEAAELGPMQMQPLEHDRRSAPHSVSTRSTSAVPVKPVLGRQGMSV